MISNEKTIQTMFKRKFQEKYSSLKFKSEINCIPLKQYKNSYVFKSFNKVKIAGISGKILVRGTKQIPADAEFANANLIHKPDGYYLKVTCYLSKGSIKQKQNNKELGLDFGIKTSITTSDSKKIDISIQESEHLKKLQKNLQRKIKGSKNRYKNILAIRKAYHCGRRCHKRFR
jgi:putative transposase